MCLCLLLLALLGLHRASCCIMVSAIYCLKTSSLPYDCHINSWNLCDGRVFETLAGNQSYRDTAGSAPFAEDCCGLRSAFRKSQFQAADLREILGLFEGQLYKWFKHLLQTNEVLDTLVGTRQRSLWRPSKPVKRSLIPGIGENDQASMGIWWSMGYSVGSAISATTKTNLID